jgi:hypothetical protein
MTTTRVVNVRTNSEKGTVYIGRPTKWGNPFTLAPRAGDGARILCIANYREWLREQPELIKAAREELKGRVLACFCAPKLCHGDVLAEVADGLDP